MFKKLVFGMVFGWLAISLLFGLALAQEPGPSSGGGSQGGGIQLKDPLGADSLEDVAASIINFLLTIAAPITGIMVLVGGFQMVTAGGNPETFSKGKKTILYAAIGFVVVLLSGSVVSLLRNVFGG